MVGPMYPYWGSLHYFCTLIVPVLAQMYKWVLVTEHGGGGGAGCIRGSLDGCAVNLTFLHPLPVHWSHAHLLKGNLVLSTGLIM